MSSNNEQDLLKSMVDTVRAASSLAAQDISFHKSLDKNINENLNNTSENVTELINSILTSINKNIDPLETSPNSYEENSKAISDVMDNLFEMSDRAMDNLSKRKGIDNAQSGMNMLDDGNKLDIAASKKIVKPQLKFSTPVDNSESHPFVPLLKSKPNALKSLEESLKMVPATDDVPAHYPQPYEFEIDNQDYDASVLQISDAIPSEPWEGTKATWVDNEEQLQLMLSDLRTATEIAVDLEHHDYRSYYGIVSLMQISNRKNDYLVDTIALRDKLQVLNEIFTNPKVIKVLHGAFMDIIWLQRDLGLYIVGLFDTYHASRALGFPRHSLAFLLEKFAKFKTSKKYQLADWRIRPLSVQMNAYARADTHFLLNIYDIMKNSLISGNKLASVLHESRKVAKRRFEYSTYRPQNPSSEVFTPTEKSEPWKSLMYQYNIPTEKSYLLQRLWEWRDLIAKRDDESPRYIMPNQLLINLISYAPTEATGVVSVSEVMTDHVRSNSKVLATLIKKALEESKMTNTIVTNKLSASNDNGNKTELTLLTIAQLKNFRTQFNNVLTKLSSNNETRNNELKKSLRFSNIICSPVMAVKYADNKEVKISEKDLEDRKEDAYTKMESLDDVPISVVLEDSIANDQVDNNDTENLSTPVVPDGDFKAERVEPENLDDVIVLKEVKRRNKPSKKNHNALHDDNDDEELKIIDYNKTNSVLNSQPKEKVNKKRKFDPFSASNQEGGPKGLKKRRNVNRGKSVSFKK